VTEVAGASREQTDGIAQINAAVGQMDKVTQSNAATAEESAAAAEELNAQAEVMKQSVAELLELVGGQSDSAAKRPAAPARRTHTIHSAGPAVKRSAAKSSNGNGHVHVASAPTPVTNRRGEIPLEAISKIFKQDLKGRVKKTRFIMATQAPNKLPFVLFRSKRDSMASAPRMSARLSSCRR